jgi:hypothetical protein
VFEVLEVCEPRHRFDVEQVMIDFYQRIGQGLIYNTLRVAGSAKGYKHTPEAMQKLRGRKMSKDAVEKCAAARRGKPRSPEVRKKLSEANKGKRHSPETKKKMSDARKGRVFPADVVEKIRRANTGRKASPETRAKIAEAARNISDETRRKMAEAKLGHKPSPESIAKRLATMAENKKKRQQELNGELQ